MLYTLVRNIGRDHTGMVLSRTYGRQRRVRKPEPGRSMKESNVAGLGAGSSSRTDFKLGPRTCPITTLALRTPRCIVCGKEAEMVIQVAPQTAMDGPEGEPFLTGARCEVLRGCHQMSLVKPSVLRRSI